MKAVPLTDSMHDGSLQWIMARYWPGGALAKNLFQTPKFDTLSTAMNRKKMRAGLFATSSLVLKPETSYVNTLVEELLRSELNCNVSGLG
jgi:hypothetical protein